MDYDMTHGIIDQSSIRPAAAFGSPPCCSGLAETLPCLCRPDPALRLAETLAPHLLSHTVPYGGCSCRHGSGATSRCSPH